MSDPKTVSPRDALLAFKITKPEAGCTPVPCPECPAPGVFVAKMNGPRYVEFLDATRPFLSDKADPPAVLKEKQANRAAVQVLFAAVDADGRPLLKSVAEVNGLEVWVTDPIVELFQQVNGLAEKKSPPPNSPPAG